MNVIFSIIPNIIGIGLGLFLCFLLFVIFVFAVAPWIGFNQFNNVDIKDVEETIFKNQLKRLQEVTGMTFPPYTARFQEPVTDLNGSFYGMIYIEFKELLKEDYWVELEKRIKDADPNSLWVDHKLKTSIILNLDKDKHYIYLKYSQIYTEGSKHGAFHIHDNRNVEPWNPKDLTSYNGFGSFGVFGSKQPLQESEETTPEKPTDISEEDS
jgi:hypothetical protein